VGFLVRKYIYHLATLEGTLTKNVEKKEGFRVTRLGKYLPIKRLFTLGSFSKIIEEAHFLLLLFAIKGVNKFIQKMGLATFWAIFCTNSSGHPGRDDRKQVITYQFTTTLTRALIRR
jgi:hypothetical protein